MLFKTNWLPTDYNFSLDDYNRIIQNVKEIRDEAQQHYAPFSQLAYNKVYDPFVVPPITYSTLLTAATTNEYLDNIRLLASNVYFSSLLKLPDNYSVNEGGTSWNYQQINDIERSLELMHQQIQSKSTGLHLNFELGGIQF